MATEAFALKDFVPGSGLPISGSSGAVAWSPHIHTLMCFDPRNSLDGWTLGLRRDSGDMLCNIKFTILKTLGNAAEPV
jgi:hypothetical protein